MWLRLGQRYTTSARKVPIKQPLNCTLCAKFDNMSNENKIFNMK